MKRVCIVAVVLVAACGAETADSVDTLAGNAELGVASYEVEQGDPGLHVIGQADDGTVVAEVTLEWGTFADVDSADEVIEGRQLTLTAGGITVAHPVRGTGPFKHPLLPTESPINELLIDPGIAGVLAVHGITAVPLLDLGNSSYPAVEEVGYDSCTFGGCGYTSCCQFAWESGYLEHRCCPGSPGTLNFRYCTFPFDQNNGCGPAGMGGCAVCSSEQCWSSCYSGDGNNCFEGGWHCN